MSAPAEIRHVPEIRRSARLGYQMRCPCGARGDDHAARRLADVDAAQHIAALPRVPAAQQCQAPKRHDRRDWEPCELCASQESLFNLTEIGDAS